ncbi:glycosyltransferase [Candidatus Saccharibacteria bacterium]|nr:glycosyltransferase [Candidatus Saccharibacteria bacterium]
MTNVGGAEKVLLELHRLYPKAPIYTSKYSKKGIDWFLDADVRTGWLQVFPASLRRFLGPLRQRWFAHLDLSEYDLVISVTGAEAKAVKCKNGLHICYCHVPTQYYWQMYDDYLKNPGFGVLNPVVRFFFKLMVGPLRKADYKAAQGPDQFVTISEYAKGMIAKYYKRDAVVIHPPVEIECFNKGKGASTACPSGTLQAALAKSSCPAEHTVLTPLPDNYYITTSRQVNWKRLDLVVQACKELRRELLVVGEGPEHNNLVKMSNGQGNIRFLPVVDKKDLAEYLAGAKCYLFPSLEPFGIAPVEALAAGCPVIALGKGGALDYVKDGVNGLLFDKQTVKALKEAMLKFETMKFDREKITKTVENFSVARFDKEIKDLVRGKTE